MVIAAHVHHAYALTLMRFLPIDIIRWLSHHFNVRTTITFDDALFELVSRQAKLRGSSLSTVVSELVRRGLTAATPSREENGVIVFGLPEDSPRVTTEEVRRIESEGA